MGLEKTIETDIQNAISMEGDKLSVGRSSNGVLLDEIVSLARTLEGTSSQSARAFLTASPSVLPFLSKEDFHKWGNLGARILERPTWGPELCQAYFQASPAVLSIGSLHHFSIWIQQGMELAEHSPRAAAKYLCYSPDFLRLTEISHLKEWAEGVKRIISTGEDGEIVALSFLGASINMLELFPFRELRDWISLGVSIAGYSAHLASTFFSLQPEELGSIYLSERRRLFMLASLIVEASPERAVEFYQRCPEILLDLSPAVREMALDSVKKTSSSRPEKILAAIEGIVSVLQPLSYPTQKDVMEQGLAIQEISKEASEAFFKNSSFLLKEIPEISLPCWVERGLSVLQRDRKKGVDYFSLKSSESDSELFRWKNAVFLEDFQNLFALLVSAITGRELRIRSTEEIDEGERSSARQYPTSDGHTIFLPPFFAEEGDHSANFRQYKVATVHQAGYFEFGTFESGISWIKSLLDLFSQKELAADIFFILEDGRIDCRLKEEYGGLAREIDLSLSEAIRKRPSPIELPLQEALIEALLRLALGYPELGEITPVISQHIAYLKETLDGFYKKSDGVWDSFLKAVKIYEYISRIPNIRPSVEQRMAGEETELTHHSPYFPSAPIPFHGRPDPEPLPDPEQWKVLSTEWEKDGGGIPLSPDELKRLLETLKELSIEKLFDGDEISSQGLFVTNLDGVEVKVDQKDPDMDEKGGHNRPFVSIPSRSSIEDGPYYYDEWDYLKGAYRRRWCCIRENYVDPLESPFVDEVYGNYSDLIEKVRRQFQQIRPEVIQVVRGVEWGDEIDLNMVIQGVVDRKAGDTPSEKIFSRKEKRLRRVSTLLLLDMSASTDEKVAGIDEERIDRRSADSTLRPDFRQEERKEKRIIDIQKESLVVIMEALEELEDEYGIFGFSGYGRQNCEFYLIKDFSESYSETLKRRINGIQPQKSTRMGAAIRHAIEKFRPIESDQRLLLLLSDGFPQDHDYGEDRRSKEYALHDTTMALLEAKREGIRPFCITVDQSGNDYLRKMCEPSSYLIIQDIHSLPEILPKLVESLMA